jgi:hypothetical protein
MRNGRNGITWMRLTMRPEAKNRIPNGTITAAGEIGIIITTLLSLKFQFQWVNVVFFFIKIIIIIIFIFCCFFFLLLSSFCLLCYNNYYYIFI